MAIQTRLLTGGMNTDTVDDLLKEGEYRMAQNLQILTDGADGASGYLEAIRGNLKASGVPAFDNGGGWELLGYGVDEAQNTFYVFLRLDNVQVIWKCVPGTVGVTPTLFLSSEWAQDGTMLCGAGAMHIDAVVSGNVLRWTDGTSDPRAAALNYNWIGGFNASDILRIPCPPRLPAYAHREIDNSKPTSSFQRESWRFAFRYTYQTGYQSVMGGWSGAARPANEPQLAFNSKYGNVIVVELGDSLIWSTVKGVELIGWQPDTDSYYLLKRWDRTVQADANALADHNSGTLPLEYRWDGSAKLEAIDKAAMGRPFDSVPVAAGTLCTIGGRDNLGGVTMGYNAPASVPAGFGVTRNIATIGGSIRFQLDAYCIMAKDTGSDTWRYAYLMRYPDGTAGWINQPGFSGTFKCDTRDAATVSSGGITMYLPQKGGPTEPGKKFQPPAETVGLSALVKIKTGSGWPAGISGNQQNVSGTIGGYLAACLGELFGISPYTAENILIQQCNIANGHYGIYVEPDLSRTGDTAFVPGSSIGVGMVFADKGGRTCGAVDLATVAIPDFGVHISGKSSATLPLCQSLTLSLPVGDQSGFIPDWAETARIVMTPNNRMSSSVEGVTYGVRRFYYAEDNNTIVPAGANTGGKKLAGYGIPLSVITASGQGYAFSPGDLCDLCSDWIGVPYPPAKDTVQVLGVYNGYLVVAPPRKEDFFLDSDKEYETWTPLLTLGYTVYTIGGGGPAVLIATEPRVPSLRKVAFRVYTPLETKPPYYEIGRATKIDRIGSNDRRFNSTIIEIPGEWNQVVSNQAAGSFVACAPKPRYGNTVSGINTDFSRIAPYDRIGQQKLSNAFVFSNPLLLSSPTGGGGTFDAGDMIELDPQAGAITSLVSITQDSAAGGAMIALCSAGSFAVLIGRTEVQGADGAASYTARTNGYVGSVSPLQWGCQSRKGWVLLDEVLYFVDGKQGQVVATTGRQSEPLAQDVVGASFQWLLAKYGNNGKAVRLGAHAKTGSVFISIGTPQRPNDLFVPDLGSSPLVPTTNTTDGSILRQQKQGVNMIYNTRLKRWVGTYRRAGNVALPDGWLQLGSRTFTWTREHNLILSSDPNDIGYTAYQNGRLWEEFVGPPGGTLCGYDQQQGLCVAFSGEPTAIKRFMAVSVDSTVAPTDGYLRIDDAAYPQITRPDLWELRDSVWRAAVLRDRMSFTGTPDATAYEMAEMEGERMRGRSLRVWYTWDVAGGGGGVMVRSVGLKTEDSGNSSWT